MELDELAAMAEVDLTAGGYPVPAVKAERKEMDQASWEGRL